MADTNLQHLYDEMRKSRNKICIFFGAGSSYDFGIPTMKEMADILKEEIKSEKSTHNISIDTLKLLSKLIKAGKGEKGKDEEVWNIEQLITRLHRIKEAIVTDSPFKGIKGSIDKEELDGEKIQNAEIELIQYMAMMCRFNPSNLIKRENGSGSIEYISDFIHLLSEFQESLRIFTTNIDLCIEAAIVRLSQLKRTKTTKDYILVDGFGSSPIPTFDKRNYVIKQTETSSNVFPIYLWKLHGSIDWTYSNPIDSEQSGSVSRSQFNDDSIICKRVESTLWEEFYNAKALGVDTKSKRQEVIIFPTPEKYFLTYSNPYIDLHESFRRTLEQNNVQLLLVVGTSFPDQHIKSAIKSFLNRENTYMFIVNPDKKLDEEFLRDMFGSTHSIQPVIKLGFKDFVYKLKQLEESTGAQEEE